MSVFSGAISTELPPAQSRMKAQLQAAEREPQLVCSYCTLQVLLNFISEHRPFCFHPPFGDAVAVACLLSKMRHFHLSRLWTREEESSIILVVCAVRDTAKNFYSPPAHVPKQCGFQFLISGRSLIFLLQFLRHRNDTVISLPQS